jgi:hypothetical protein
MVDEPENLTLRMLRQIDAKIDGLKDDFRELKARVIPRRSVCGDEERSRPAANRFPCGLSIAWTLWTGVWNESTVGLI